MSRKEPGKNAEHSFGTLNNTILNKTFVSFGIDERQLTKTTIGELMIIVNYFIVTDFWITMLCRKANRKWLRYLKKIRTIVTDRFLVIKQSDSKKAKNRFFYRYGKYKKKYKVNISQ